MNTYKISKISGVSIALIALLALVVLMPGLAHAQEVCTVRSGVSAEEATDLLSKPHGAVAAGAQLTLDGPEAGDNALICTYGFVKFVTNIVFIAVLILAALFIALSAFFYVTAAANAEKKTKARDFLVWAIVGLVVASLARVIPAIVRGVIGL